MADVMIYMLEQKRKLTAKHEGETFFINANNPSLSVEVGGRRTPTDVLKEIDGLEGLNVNEREFFSRTPFSRSAR